MKTAEMKLTNEELVKVFAMYLGCELLGQWDGERKGYLTGIHGEYGAEIQFFEDDGINVFEHPEYNTYNEVKLLLSPLSKITDEHAIKVAYTHWPDSCNENVDTRWLKRVLSTICKRYDIHQYLISKGYAVPLWFGIGHWANGKTAIELNIAVEAKT